MLRVAYINTDYNPIKKLTAEEELHQEAMVTVANARAQDRLKIPLQLAEEYRELEMLEAELKQLKQL